MNSRSRRRTEREPRSVPSPGDGRVCAWLGCSRLVIDRVAGRPYCPRHASWARAFAARRPDMPPPWLSTAERAPWLWESATPERRSRMRAGQLRGLALMEADGLERVLAVMAVPVSARGGGAR